MQIRQKTFEGYDLRSYPTNEDSLEVENEAELDTPGDKKFNLSKAISTGLAVGIDILGLDDFVGIETKRGSKLSPGEKAALIARFRANRRFIFLYLTNKKALARIGATSYDGANLDMIKNINKYTIIARVDAVGTNEPKAVYNPELLAFDSTAQVLTYGQPNKYGKSVSYQLNEIKGYEILLGNNSIGEFKNVAK